MEIGLNEKQLIYLKQVYTVRSKFLLGPTIFFLCILLMILAYQFNNINDNLKGIGLMAIQYKQTAFAFYFLLPTIILLIIISIYCWQHLVSIERDIKNRSGEQVDFQILRKAYFPITNECFFFFREEEIPNIQIDHVTFLSYDEGSYFYIYRSLHSKIVFENYLRFDLI